MGSIKVILIASAILFLSHLRDIAQGNTPSGAAGQSVTIVEGHTVTMHADATDAASFQWLKDGNAISGATQNSYVASTSGKYQVLSVNLGNCGSMVSDPVTVNVIPASASDDMMISLTAPATTINSSDPFTYTITIKNNGAITATGVNVADILPAGVQFLQLSTPSTGSANYNNTTKNISWTVGQLAPGEEATITVTVKPTSPGTITNTATVSADQTDPNPANNTATAINTATGLTIPNVFTPNGDNVNDAFVILGLELYPENELTIINRWGAIVYQKKGYQNNWDGSGLNEGTYFYFLKVHTTAQKWETYHGYITLLRTKVK
ncbi:gliding motility-associated C-terminal domain-containing protein [Mucilaginibacter sp. dw_454]|uniref:T9SS type B sorting domain-containing protein n=1 Tax=Mucilaginibacter sp. dw_454 TaxID=2720079 RepID=UPI001BD3EB99|nr:gliding motility-associated C-terminal domain-containing protein [Mucilaginibacter sp. dw_454]